MGGLAGGPWVSLKWNVEKSIFISKFDYGIFYSPSKLSNIEWVGDCIKLL